MRFGQVEPRTRSKAGKPRWPGTPPIFNTPEARVVADCGGMHLSFRFKPLQLPENGGCSYDTHVDGTNGGVMPCGALLKQLDGTIAPYYCARCSLERAQRETR